MNFIKPMLLVTLLTSFLIGCGDDTATYNSTKNAKITGVFGLKLADKAQGLPEGYLDDNKAYDFTPNPVHKHFSSYTISVTPNTHMIYGIKVASSKELSIASCKENRNDIIAETLAALGDISTLSVNEDGNQWKITEGNNRSIIIECKHTLVADSHQLVMTYTDAKLSKLSFVEWSKHQDDIVKGK